jgi:hypothetical protein
MKRIIVLFVITVAFVLNVGICKAAPRKVRIASHVSKASPLYATAKEGRKPTNGARPTATIRRAA